MSEEDYQKLLDQAKALTIKIQALDVLIASKKIASIEQIEITLTAAQLQPFIDKRAELKTKKDELCNKVETL